MSDYKNLTNKKINLVFNGKTINSYWINEIIPTGEESIDGREKLFRCFITWENKELGRDYPELIFETYTLNDLAEKNIAICPFMPSLFYMIELNQEK